MLTSALQLLWFLAACLCLFGRLEVLPRFMAQRRDPDIRPYFISVIGQSVFDVSVIVVTAVLLLWTGPRPPIVGVLVTGLLTIGYLGASIPALLLIRYWLRIGEQRNPPKEE